MQINLPEGALEESVSKGIRATIMAGAVQLILKELTPERLEQFTTGVLDEAIQDLNSYKLRNKLLEVAEPIIAAFCRRPEIIAQVEVAVEEGILKFLKNVPDIVHEEIKSVVIGAIVDKFDKRRRY